jgi:hypothetical protein
MNIVSEGYYKGYYKSSTIKTCFFFSYWNHLEVIMDRKAKIKATVTFPKGKFGSSTKELLFSLNESHKRLEWKLTSCTSLSLKGTYKYTDKYGDVDEGVFVLNRKY